MVIDAPQAGWVGGAACSEGYQSGDFSDSGNGFDPVGLVKVYEWAAWMAGGSGRGNFGWCYLRVMCTVVGGARGPIRFEFVEAPAQAGLEECSPPSTTPTITATWRTRRFGLDWSSKPVTGCLSWVWAQAGVPFPYP